MTVADLKALITPGTRLTRVTHEDSTCLEKVAIRRVVTQVSDSGFYCQSEDGKITTFSPWPKSDDRLISNPNGFKIDRITWTPVTFEWGWRDPEGQATP